MLSPVGQAIIQPPTRCPPLPADRAGEDTAIGANAETTLQSLDIDITFDGQSARGTVRVQASKADNEWRPAAEHGSSWYRTRSAAFWQPELGSELGHVQEQ
jgi:hypothetical protein